MVAQSCGIRTWAPLERIARRGDNVHGRAVKIMQRNHAAHHGSEPSRDFRILCVRVMHRSIHPVFSDGGMKCGFNLRSRAAEHKRAMRNWNFVDLKAVAL